MQTGRLRSPAALSSCRCQPAFRAARPAARQRTCARGMRMRCRASLEEDMEEMQQKIREKQSAMQRHAEAEDYKAAAAERDSINLLELRRRELDFQLDKERRVIRYGLGTVIQHKRFKYKGVIVGYEDHCNAPEVWIKGHKIDELSLGRNQPFYHVLVDNNDRPGAQTFVAQENIDPLPPSAASPVEHELVSHNFHEFADGRYRPKEFLVEEYKDRPVGGRQSDAAS